MEKRKIKNIVIGSAVGIFLVVCIVVMTVVTHNANKPIDGIVGVWKSVDENAYISIDDGQITYATKGKTTGRGGIIFTRYYNSKESDKVYTDIRDVEYVKTYLPESVDYHDKETIAYNPFRDDGKVDNKWHFYKK